MSDMILSMLLTLKDLASGPLGQTQSKIQKFSHDMMAIGATSKMMGSSILNAMKTPIQAFSDAEDASTSLKVAMMDAGGHVDKSYGKVNDLATQLGSKLPGTTADLQNMMTALKQQNVTAEAMLGGVGKAAAYLGVNLKMPYVEAAKFAAKTGEAAGVAAQDMEKFMDIISRTSNLGVEAGEMQYAFSRSAGALKAVKMQGLESAASMSVLYAQFIKAGASGETVGTNFGGMLENLKKFQYGIGDKADSAKKSLKGLGIEMQFFDKQGKFLGPREMIGQLEKLKNLKPDKRAKAMDSLFGGGQDAQMVNTLMDGGVKAYDLMNKRMKDQADLNTKVEAQLKTLKNVWDAASGTFTNTLASIIEPLAPDLKRAADLFGDLSLSIGKFTKEHPQLTRIAAGLALVTGAALVTGGTAIMGVGMAANAFSSAMPIFGKVAEGAGKIATGGKNAAVALKGWNASTGAMMVSNTQAAGGGLSKLPGLIKAKASAMAQATRSGLTAMPGQMKAYGASIASATSGGLKSMPGLIRAKSSAMLQGVSAAASWTRGNLLSVSGLKNLATATGGRLVGGLKAVSMGIRAIGLTAMANPIGLVALGIAAGALIIYKYWRPISGFFRGLWSGLKAGLAPLGAAFTSAFAPVAPLFAPIMAGIRGVWNWLKSLIAPVQDVGGKAEAMGQRFGQGVATAINFGAKMLGYFLALPGQFMAIGTNIVTGLLNGIMSAAGRVFSYVSEMAGKIKSAFAGMMGIASPSRVFMGFGQNIGAGLEIGMAGTSNKVVGAAKSMAKAAIPKFPKASGPELALAGRGSGAAGAGSGMQIKFAPVIQLSIAPGSNVGQQVEQAMRLSYSEFEKMMERYVHNNKRRSA